MNSTRGLDLSLRKVLGVVVYSWRRVWIAVILGQARGLPVVRTSEDLTELHMVPWLLPLHGSRSTSVVESVVRVIINHRPAGGFGRHIELHKLLASPIPAPS